MKIASHESSLRHARPGQTRQELSDGFAAELTNPADVQTDSFVLAVHTVNTVMVREFRESLQRTGRYEAKRDVDLLKTPERLKEKGILSASIVSAEQCSTFGRLLFVLGFGLDSVLATTVEDGYVNEKEGQLLEQPLGATMTPLQMLASAKGDHHNEITLCPSGVSIKAVGVKAMIRPDGSVEIPAEAQRMREIATELKVPYIEMRERCGLPDAAVKVFCSDSGKVQRVTLSDNGAGYTFTGKQWNVRYFHSQGKDVETIPLQEYAALRGEIVEALAPFPQGEAFLHDLDLAMNWVRLRHRHDHLRPEGRHGTS